MAETPIISLGWGGKQGKKNQATGIKIYDNLLDSVWNDLSPFQPLGIA